MNRAVRIMIENGKKTKKVVAVAFDWPGWERVGKGEDEALAVLESYQPRYRRVAELAGLAEEFDAAGDLQVVERIEESTSPDFFGISGKSAAPEYEPMTEAECERKLALLRGCWAYFDETWPHISEELKKSPRGRVKNRDQVVRHTYASETENSKKVGVRTSVEDSLDFQARAAHRLAFQDAIREFNAENKSKSSWTLQFIIRRCCYHMLDHAWELEDKDLSDVS